MQGGSSVTASFSRVSALIIYMAVCVLTGIWCMMCAVITVQMKYTIHASGFIAVSPLLLVLISVHVRTGVIIIILSVGTALAMI